MKIADEESKEPSSYNLICTLFGNKETVELISTISHQVDPKSPRCLQQYWDVYGCTRCEEALGMELLVKHILFAAPKINP